MESKSSNHGGSKKKSATLRTRKSLGKIKKASKDESDDEFMPTTNNLKTKTNDRSASDTVQKRAIQRTGSETLQGSSRDVNKAKEEKFAKAKKEKKRESPKRKM